MLDYDKIELNKLLVEIDDTNLINHIVLTGYVITIYLQYCSVTFLYPSLRESIPC
jgi:hypothetical protein